MLILESTMKETRLQAGDLICWRLNDGNVGFARNGTRILFDGHDDRGVVQNEQDTHGISVLTAMNISSLIAHVAGLKVKVHRHSDNNLVLEMI